MSTPDKRNPACGPGFEKLQTIGDGLHAHDTARRAGYRGVTLPVSRPPRRARAAIADDLRQAGDMLRYYASEVAGGIGGGRTLADIDRLVIGVSHLVRELREVGR